MRMPNITRLSLIEAKKRIESYTMPKTELQAALLHTIESLLTKSDHLTKSSHLSSKIAVLVEYYEKNKPTLPVPSIEIELQYLLALCYREGLGIGMDGYRARQMFVNIIEGYPNSISKLQGTAHPHSYAMVELAFFNINSTPPNDIPGALNFLRLAASRGNSLAQYHLSRLFKKGQFVETSPTKANEYLLLAAEAGLAVAQYDLAVELVISSQQDIAGKNSEENVEIFKQARNKIQEAYSWFKHAAYNGNCKANYYLGRYYQQGYTDVLQQDFKYAAEHYLVFLQQSPNNASEGVVESIMLKGMYNFANMLLSASTNSQNREFVQLGLKLMQALADKNYKEAEAHVKTAKAVTEQHSPSSASQSSASRSASRSPQLTKIDFPLRAEKHEGVVRTPSPVGMGNSPVLSAKQNSASSSGSSASSSCSAASHSYSSSAGLSSSSSQDCMILDNQETEDAENVAMIEYAGNEGLSDSASIPSPNDANSGNVKTNADTSNIVLTASSSKMTLKSLRIPRPNTDPALVNAAFKPPKPFSAKVSSPLLDITNLSHSASVFAPFKPPKQNQSPASVVYCETWAKKMLNAQIIQSAQTMQYAQNIQPTSQQQVSALTFMSQTQRKPSAKLALSATSTRSHNYPSTH